MTTDKTTPPFLPKSVNWLRVIAESVSGLPGGKIVLGGLLKQYDSESDRAKREEMENRIATLIEVNRDISLKHVEALFSDLRQNADNRAALKLIPVVLNEQINSMKDSRVELSAEQVRRQLAVTAWPFPAVPQDQLIAELHSLFTSIADLKNVRDLAYKYDFGIQENASPSQMLTDICRGVRGTSRFKLKQFVSELVERKPESEILGELMVFCNAWVAEGGNS